MKHLKTNVKFYPVDTGMLGSILYGYEVNDSALLECVVFLELIRRGYRVSVGSYRNKEIDFTAWLNDSTPEFYQVSLKIEDMKTLSRELSAFRNLDPSSKKILITMDSDEHEMPEGVESINAIDWLLSDVGSLNLR